MSGAIAPKQGAMQGLPTAARNVATSDETPRLEPRMGRTAPGSPTLRCPIWRYRQPTASGRKPHGWSSPRGRSRRRVPEDQAAGALRNIAANMMDIGPPSEQPSSTARSTPAASRTARRSSTPVHRGDPRPTDPTSPARLSKCRNLENEPNVASIRRGSFLPGHLDVLRCGRDRYEHGPLSEHLIREQHTSPLRADLVRGTSSTCEFHRQGRRRRISARWVTPVSLSAPRIDTSVTA